MPKFAIHKEKTNDHKGILELRNLQTDGDDFRTDFVPKGAVPKSNFIIAKSAPSTKPLDKDGIDLAKSDTKTLKEIINSVTDEKVKQQLLDELSKLTGEGTDGEKPKGDDNDVQTRLATLEATIEELRAEIKAGAPKPKENEKPTDKPKGESGTDGETDDESVDRETLEQQLAETNDLIAQLLPAGEDGNLDFSEETINSLDEQGQQALNDLTAMQAAILTELDNLDQAA